MIEGEVLFGCVVGSSDGEWSGGVVVGGGDVECMSVVENGEGVVVVCICCGCMDG